MFHSTEVLTQIPGSDRAGSWGKITFSGLLPQRRLPQSWMSLHNSFVRILTNIPICSLNDCHFDWGKTVSM